MSAPESVLSSMQLRCWRKAEFFIILFVDIDWGNYKHKYQLLLIILSTSVYKIVNKFIFMLISVDIMWLFFPQ